MKNKYDPTALTVLLERLRRMPKGKAGVMAHARMRKLMGGVGRKTPKR